MSNRLSGEFLPLPGLLPRERLWVRAAALGIDFLVLAGIPLLASTAVVFGILLVTPDPPVSLSAGFRLAQAVFALLFLFRDARGASPGKTLLGIRVVTRTGRRVTPFASLVRNAPLLVPGWILVEGFSVLRRPDARRPGDRAAGTIVVEG